MTRAGSFRRIFVLVLPALFHASAAGALTFVRTSDESLVDGAAVIVRAAARPLEKPPAAGLPLTWYSLEVKRALHGAASGERLELAVPGGRNAAGDEAVVFGVPFFAAGEETLFLLDRRQDGSLGIRHLNQGAFRVARLSGKSVAWRDFTDAEEISASGEIAAELPRDLEKFETWIADRLAGRHRAADYAVATAPGEMGNLISSFVIQNWNGLRIRWPKSTGRLSLTVFAHEVPQVGIAGGGYPQTQAALDSWTGTGLLDLRYGGLTSSAAGFNYRDGQNTIVFNDFANANGSHPPHNCTNNTGAIAWGLAWVSGTHFYGGSEYRTIVEGEAVVSEGFECWRRASPVTLERLIGHEVGHMLGLAHACEGNPANGPVCDTPDEHLALMRGGLIDPSPGSVLSNDDREAIRYIYGPPSRPGFLAADLRPGNRVELAWEDSSDNETGFAIFRRDGSFLEQIGHVGADATRFDDTTAGSGRTYVYGVRAENENGLSAPVEATLATADLEAPVQLVLSEAGADFLSVSWADKSGLERGYELWGHLFGADQLLASLPADVTTATLTNLIADSTYSLKVRATGLPTGNTAFSNTLAASTLPAPAGPCEESGVATCLSGERFKVEVSWQDFAGHRGRGTLAPAGSADSGVFYFFSPNNWEMLVKVLDGCAINGKTWVFAAATTDVETTLIVTDSQTGKTAVYWNPLGQASPAVTDIAAFDGCAEGTTAQQIPAGAAPVCGDGSGNLCLLGGRYRVKVTWTDFVGQQGLGRAVPAGTGDSGLLYFFSPDNWEMLVKVLDGCAINGKVWVFAAATTNVAYTLEVEDTETGLAKTYENPLGKPSVAIADIVAFETCGGD